MKEPQIHFSQSFQRKPPRVTWELYWEHFQIWFTTTTRINLHNMNRDKSASIPVWCVCFFQVPATSDSYVNIQAMSHVRVHLCAMPVLRQSTCAWTVNRFIAFSSLVVKMCLCLCTHHVHRDTVQQTGIGHRDPLWKSSLNDKWQMTGPVFTKHLLSLWAPPLPVSPSPLRLR